MDRTLAHRALDKILDSRSKSKDAPFKSNEERLKYNEALINRVNNAIALGANKGKIESKPDGDVDKLRKLMLNIIGER